MLYLHYTVAFPTGPGKERKNTLKDEINANDQSMNKHRTKDKLKLRIPCTCRQKFNYHYSKHITL